MTLRPEPLWGGPLRIWRMPTPGDQYAIGADPAGGKSSGDWASAVVCDSRDGSVCATYRAHIEPSPFAQILFDLGTFYGEHMDGGQAFLVPEGNNHGIALIDALRALGYWNLYARQTWDRIEKQFVPSVGFLTSLKTKPILLRRIMQALANVNCDIPDPIILQEASTYIVNESGREEAMEGKNDDTLIAFGLAQEGVWVSYNPTATQDGAPVVPQKWSPKVGDARDRRWVWDSLEDAVERQAPRRVTYIRR